MRAGSSCLDITRLAGRNEGYLPLLLPLVRLLWTSCWNQEGLVGRVRTAVATLPCGWRPKPNPVVARFARPARSLPELRLRPDRQRQRRLPGVRNVRAGCTHAESVWVMSRWLSSRKASLGDAVRVAQRFIARDQASPAGIQSCKED